MIRVSRVLVLLPWLFAAAGLTLHAQSVTVNWANVHQTIDGFGASTADDSDPTDAYETGPMNSAQAQLFFSTTNGVGLSLMKTLVPNDGSCVTVSGACASQVSDMQLAQSYGVRIWSAPWSPPASMKSNGATVCTNNSGLLSSSYGAYATYLSNYIASLSTLYNIPLYALSVQNEPDNCPSNYPGAIWSASNFDKFIKNNLGPTLAANGQSGVRIVMPESSVWANFTSKASTCMADAACASYVGINAWHDYDVASSITNPYSSLGKGFWETEVSDGAGFGPSTCGGCWDPSMTDALYWAGIIDSRMAVSNANAWNYWEFLDQEGDNEGLVFMGVAAQRLYVMGNYAKFVRPGWVRIDATHVPASGMTVSAYKDPVAGGFAIVVTNQNASTETLSVSLAGFSASSVTPWTTSATLSLAQGSDIPVASSSFTATISPSSVTTFVGLGTPSPLAITTASLPAGVVGTAYSATVLASGGTPPYSWTYSGLAPGLSLNATTGQITGTPTAASSYSEEITVTDSATPTNASASAVFTVTIAPPPQLTITTTSLPGGTVGKAYSASVAAKGGVPPYSWTYSGLAPGLALNATTGQITGTPTAAASYSETITVTDSEIPSGVSTSAVFGITIAPASPITITTTSLPGGTVGQAYSASVAAKGGVPPYTITASNLPAGLSVSTSGAITGTPTTAGTYSPTFMANDSLSDPPATTTFTLTVSPVPTGSTIRVRAGATAAYTDPSGNVWAADKYFSGGSTSSTTHSISNTTTQPLYQTERYNGFTYTFTGLPTGATYTVTLKFAEIYWTAAGKRVFNVILNGKTVLSAFDIFKDAGGQYIADDKTFSTTVSKSGQIVIQFQNGSADYAKVDAIQVAP